MADTILTALLSGKETISSSFDDASDSVSEYRGEMRSVADESSSYTEEIDEAGDESERFGGSLGSVLGNAQEAMSSIFGANEAVIESGEEAEQAASDVEGYGSSLGDATGLASALEGENEDLAESFRATGDSTDFDLPGFRVFRQNADAATRSLDTLDAETGGYADTATETAESTDDLLGALTGLRETADEDVLSTGTLDTTISRFEHFSDEQRQALDALIETSGGIDDLDTNLATLDDALSDATEGTSDLETRATELDDTLGLFAGRDITIDEPDTDGYRQGAEDVGVLRRGLGLLPGVAGPAAAATTVAGESADEAGDEMSGAAAETGLFGGMLGWTTGPAAAYSAAMEGVEEQTDEAGDEAEESTAGFLGLAGALGIAGGAGSGFSSEIFGIRGGLTSILLLLPALVGLLGAAVVPMLGLATAAAGLGGALAAVFGAGLLARGERLAETSSEIEDKWQGVSEIFSQVGDRAAQALEPLETLGGTDFVMGGFDFVLGVIEDLVTLTANLWPSFEHVLDTWAEMAGVEGGQFFAELENLIRALLPYVGMLGEWIIKNAVPALRYLREEGVALTPEMGELGGAIAGALPPLITFGGIVLDVLIPGLVWAIGVLAAAISWFNKLPSPIRDGIVALGGLFAGAVVVASALSALGGAVGLVSGFLLPALMSAAYAAGAAFGLLKFAVLGLVGVLGLPVTIILLLAGAVAAVITYFDLWNEVIMGLQTAFNGLLDMVEGFINTLGGGLYGVVNDAIGAIEGLIETANAIPGVNIDADLPDLGKWQDVSTDDMKVKQDGTMFGLGYGDKKGPDDKGGGGGGGPRGPGGGGGGPRQPPRDPWANMPKMGKGPAGQQARAGDYIGTNIGRMSIEQPAPKEDSDARNERIAKQAYEQETQKRQQRQYGGAS